jgi:hypothetical protein
MHMALTHIKITSILFIVKETQPRTTLRLSFCTYQEWQKSKNTNNIPENYRAIGKQSIDMRIQKRMCM